MSATAYTRGHPITFNELAGEWVFADTLTPIAGVERPCTLCGKTAEVDGPDPCWGMLPGVKEACCGHGVQPPYIMWDNGEVSG